jgi:hypothetical protein
MRCGHIFIAAGVVAFAHAQGQIELPTPVLYAR